MGISLAIEGIDGSGKRTLAENLKKKFESINIESEIISFPRHQEEFSGMLVDKFLYENLRFNDDNFKEVREGMLYAIDRMVSLGRIRENGKSLLDEYNNDKLLIFDRYLSSNFIHRCNDMDTKQLRSYINTMKYIEFKLLGLPEPDITLVLSVQPEVSYNNIIKRGRETDENETIENLTKSFNKLKYLCKIENYKLIDCCKKNENGIYEMLSREEILEKAWEALEIPEM
jgi:thymidylate kinase